MSHPQRTDLEPTVPVGADMPTGLRLLAAGRDASTGHGEAGVPAPVVDRKPWMPPDFTGSILGGRYRILRMLGFGGMATVYEAEHVQIEKRVAVKVLNPDYADDREIAGRFLQEARTASKLRHEHIIDITDFGHADGTVFFVMELLEGEDLSTTLLEEGPLAPQRLIAIARQICTALAAAHALGIIHRDIKPANCFRISRGNNADFIKVLDFGIAKVATSPDRDAQRTTGAPLGTPGYMALELLKGEAYDHRVDIYAVGVLMYKLLTNKMPFPALNAYGTLARQLDGEPLPLSEAAPDQEIPEPLERLILRAMARDPGDRFQSAIELLDGLDAVERAIRGPARSDRQLGRDPLDWDPPPAPTVVNAPVVAPSRRRLALALTAGLGAALLVALGVASWLLGRPPGEAIAAMRPLQRDLLARLAAAEATPPPADAAEPGASSGPSPTAPPEAPPEAPAEAPVDAPRDAAGPGDEPPVEEARPAPRAPPRALSAAALARRLEDRLKKPLAQCRARSQSLDDKHALQVRLVFDGPSGKVKEVSDLNGGALASIGACALEEIKQVQLPAAQGEIELIHTFTF